MTRPTRERDLLAQRREEARRARLEVPPRVVSIPAPVVAPEDLWPLLRAVYARHPHLTFGGLRLVGIGRDEWRWEAV